MARAYGNFRCRTIVELFRNAVRSKGAPRPRGSPRIGQEGQLCVEPAIIVLLAHDYSDCGSTARVHDPEDIAPDIRGADCRENERGRRWDLLLSNHRQG